VPADDMEEPVVHVHEPRVVGVDLEGRTQVVDRTTEIRKSFTHFCHMAALVHDDRRLCDEPKARPPDADRVGELTVLLVEVAEVVEHAAIDRLARGHTRRGAFEEEHGATFVREPVAANAGRVEIEARGTDRVGLEPGFFFEQRREGREVSGRRHVAHERATHSSDLGVERERPFESAASRTRPPEATLEHEAALDEEPRRELGL
jgi:hypothetical protein